MLMVATEVGTYLRHPRRIIAGPTTGKEETRRLLTTTEAQELEPAQKRNSLTIIKNTTKNID